MWRQRRGPSSRECLTGASSTVCATPLTVPGNPVSVSPVSDVTSLVTCARAWPAAGPAPPHPSWLTSPARAPASATRTPRSVLEAVSARPVTPGRPGPRMSSSTWGHKRRGLCGLDTSAYCHLCTQSSGVFYRDSFIIIFFSKVICLNITISWSSLKIYQEYHDWLNRIFVKR